MEHAGRTGWRVVLAFVATAFAQDMPQGASQLWRNVKGAEVHRSWIKGNRLR
ncbi:hypothetical protein [Rhizobium jaguaris]|nr:hypothetical protein [Rhizobium jaguaris]